MVFLIQVGDLPPCDAIYMRSDIYGIREWMAYCGIGDHYYGGLYGLYSYGLYDILNIIATI